MSTTTAAKIRREITRDGRTVRYVHVFCDACTYWHAFAWDVATSFDPAERHLINVHGLDPREAGTARRQWEHKQRVEIGPAFEGGPSAVINYE